MFMNPASGFIGFFGKPEANKNHERSVILSVKGNAWRLGSLNYLQ